MPLTRELSEACRVSGLRFGCYDSIDRDCYRPQGPGNGCQQNNVWNYPDSTKGDFDRYFERFAKPQVETLLTRYRPDLLWFDEIDMKSDAQVEELYRSIRKLRPECVVNSRIKTCSFPDQVPRWYCDDITSGDNEILDKAIGFECQNSGSMNTSYGDNQNDHNWVDAKENVFHLVDIVSKRGNYLLSVGPRSEGLIPQPCIDRLMEVGAWMETNQEVIYGSSPWRVFQDEAPSDRSVKTAQGGALDIRFTTKGSSVYAIRLNWPDREVHVRALRRGGVSGKTITGASMLGAKGQAKSRQTDDGLTLSVPREKPCRYAFVYRIDFRKD